MSTKILLNKRKWYQSVYLWWFIVSTIASTIIISLAAYIFYFKDHIYSFLEKYMLIFLLVICSIPELILIVKCIMEILSYNNMIDKGMIINGKIYNYNLNVFPSVNVEFIANGRRRKTSSAISRSFNEHILVLFLKENPQIEILTNNNYKRIYVLFDRYIQERDEEILLSDYKKRQDGSYILNKFPDFMDEISNPMIIEGMFRRKMSKVYQHSGRSLSHYYDVDAVVTYLNPDTGEELHFKGKTWISTIMFHNYRFSQYDFPVKVVVNRYDMNEYRVCLDESLERILSF